MNDVIVLANRVKSWEERFLESLTRENWVRWRSVVELGAAGVYFLCAVAYAARAMSIASLEGLAALFLAALFAAAIALHRVQPVAALVVSALAIVGMAVVGLAGSVNSVGLAWFPLMVVVFGAAAYGRQITRIAALVLALGVALLVGVNAWWYGYGSGIGSVALIALAGAVLGIPWLAGALIRLALSRRSLGDSVVATEVKLNAAEHDVSIEQERNRVARDVHDIVAHSLAVVIAQADGARYAARTSPAAVDEALTTIAVTAREALTDVRALLTELRHSQERGPQPGMNDLDALVRGFRESGLDVEWSSYGVGVPVSESTGLAVYRVVQESLTNALRHGGRQKPVDIEFDWTDSTLAVTVTNDVVEGERVVNKLGHGIPGMHERATLAGGSFSAADGTNGRFRVRATFPLDRTAARTQPISTVPQS